MLEFTLLFTKIRYAMVVTLDWITETRTKQNTKIEKLISFDKLGTEEVRWRERERNEMQ